MGVAKKPIDRSSLRDVYDILTENLIRYCTETTMKKTLLSLTLMSHLALVGCSSLSDLVLIEKKDEDKTVEDFYKDATDGFKEAQWDIAILNYEKLKAFFPYGAHTEQTYLELAYAYYKYDEPESAIQELEEFIRLYPKHSQIPYAYYLKALAKDSITKSWLDGIITDPASRDMTAILEAFNEYSELVSRFPDSDYSQFANKRLIVLRNQLARRELIIAKFYLDKQAFLAAAQRANNILENYPQSAVTQEALEVLITAYDRLGMEENRDMVLQVYQLNQKS
jgi:outer membrane protein assembly factor BamD